MAFTIHPDRKEAVRLISKPGQASFRTSGRAALGDITNTNRLNKSRAENISTGFISEKGHKRSNAIYIPVLELPKFLSKPLGVAYTFSAENYSQSDPELDDAASEGSQLSVDSTIDPQTFENTLVNSPYLERPTKSGVKEIKDAVLERETQPIDEVSEALKLDHHPQPRTVSRRADILAADDEQDAQLGSEHIKHRTYFAYALAKISSSCPSTQQENNNIIENWLETSSSLWNADVRLSTSGIELTGNELTLAELETASHFAELNLPSLPQLISAIERVGKSPSNETKEIVVEVLRSPEVASKLKEYNLTITLERFDAAINCNQEEWKESEVLKDYNIARDEVETQPGSVTPESSDGNFDEEKVLEVPAQVNELSITELDTLPIRPSGFVPAIDASHSLPLHKVHKKVSFANETTIIGNSDSHTEYISTSIRSAEIIKEAKVIGRAYSSVVLGVEHIQKNLFGMDIPTRMKVFDQQFASQVASKTDDRKAKSASRQDSPFGLDWTINGVLQTPFHVCPDGFTSAPLTEMSCGLDGTIDVTTEQSRMQQFDRRFSSQVAPQTRGTVDEDLDTPFHISPDGWITAPLLPTPFPPVPTDESMELRGHHFSRIEWNRD